MCLQLVWAIIYLTLTIGKYNWTKMGPITHNSHVHIMYIYLPCISCATLNSIHIGNLLCP